MFRPFISARTSTHSLVAVLFFLIAVNLHAQFDLTNNDGGTSTTGNLYEAVTAINGTLAGGTVTLDMAGSNTINLQQALPALSQNVTLLGTPGDMALTLIASNEAQGAVTFSNSLTVNNLTLGAGVSIGIINNASVTAQQDVTLYEANLSMGVSSAIALVGGNLSLSGPTNGNATAGTPDLFLLNLNAGSGSIINESGGTLTNSNVLTGNASGGRADFLADYNVIGSGAAIQLTGGDVNNASATITGAAFGGSAQWLGGFPCVLGAGTTLNLNGGNVNNSGGSIGVSAVGGYVDFGGALSIGVSAVCNVTGGNVNNSGGTILGAAWGGSVDVGLANAATLAQGSSLNVSGGMVDNSGGGQSASVSQGTVYLTSGILDFQSGSTLRASGSGVTVNIQTLEGSGTITLSGGSDTLFVQSGDFSGTISGNESLVKQTTGLLILAGSNTYSGGTTLLGGILRVQTSASLGSPYQTLTFNGGALQTEGNFTSNRPVSIAANGGTVDVENLYYFTDLKGAMSGPGVLYKTGPGDLELEGLYNSLGGIQISQGTIYVPYGMNIGTGTVVNNGFIQTWYTSSNLQMGNFYQTPNGTLQLSLGINSPPTNPIVKVTGTASLSGTLELDSYGIISVPVGTLVPLITAGQVQGQFTTIREYIVGARFLPVYLPNAVELESIIPSFTQVAYTSNQVAIGRDLDYLFNTPQEYGLMRNLGFSNNYQIEGALQQMSPEGLVSIYQSMFNQATLESGLMNGRMAWLRKDAESPTDESLKQLVDGGTPFASTLPARDEAAMEAGPSEGQWNGSMGWTRNIFTVGSAQTYYGYQSGSSGLFTANLDKKLTPSLAVGFMVGYGSFSVGLSPYNYYSYFNGGSVSGVGGLAGIYGTWFKDGLYVDASGQAGFETYNSLRLGYGGTAVGNTPGDEYGGQLTMGYEQKKGDLSFGPEVSGQFIRVDMTGFSEQGSLTPLTIPSQNSESLISRAGAQAHLKLNFVGIRIEPRLNLAWEHEFNYQGGTLRAGFGQGDQFTVLGSPVGMDGVLLDAGLGMAFTQNLELSLRYQGEFARTNLTSQQLGGSLNLAL